MYLVAALAILVAVLVIVPEKHVTSSAAPGAASGTGSGTGSIVVPHGVTPPTATYAHGTTVGGVACGPGVSQVAWSAYAPGCQPAWHGNNGGATTRGVTPTAIYLTYRAASTAQLAELYGLVPPSVVGTNPEEIATMKAYVNAFNKSFELYGRKVVLVSFPGKGDFIDETLGEDQTQAEEDAVTVATSIKAFADMSLVNSSPEYVSDLSAEHVVTSSLYENAASWYPQYSPWVYTPGPNCTKSANATGAILGKQLGGLPASFAGPGLNTKTRVFGIVYTESPTDAVCASEDAAALAKYGQKVVASVGVKFDLTQLIATADSAVAQMKAAGVTTVVLSAADPITPKFYMEAADNDNYHPEWWFQSDFSGGETNTDPFTRLFPADQTGHIIGFGNQTQPYNTQEPINAFKLGNTVPGATPIPTYTWTYQSLLQFFDALQLAGPDLTPTNFQAAMNRIPQSLDWGFLGAWNGTTGPYDPASGYHVVRFDPTTRSPMDGKPGTFIACDDNQAFSYANDSAVPSHQQLTCSASTGVQSPPPSASHITPGTG